MTEGNNGSDLQQQLVEFAESLDELRRAAGLTYRDLARRAECPKSTVNDALTGRRFPRLDTVLAIVRACGGDEVSWRARWCDVDRIRSRSTPATAPDPPGGVPTELPHVAAGFAGRDVELAWLHDLLTAQTGRDPEPVVIASIDGLPGVGKTALAIRSAHQLVDRFPDGQIFLNLRGHRAQENPLPPGHALEQLLRALGVPSAQIPAELDERARRYRSAVAGRRVLLILDDAASADQVRPLLPGDPRCAVIVTSRTRLDGLAVRDGANRLGLGVLTTAEAHGLLCSILGSERVGAEPAAAATLAELCARLPLALRIAAAHLIENLGRGIGELVHDLGTTDRLTALAIADDDAASVRAAFDLSYRNLPADARLLFRRLGLVAGPDLTVEVAAVLAGVDVSQAARQLRTLATVHLVEQFKAGRYQLHDLLRLYAIDLADTEDTETDREAARDRLMDWYIGHTIAATSVLCPHLLRLPHATRTPHAFADQASAMSWLGAERDNLVAAIQSAADHGSYSHAWRLADALRGFLQLKHHRDSWHAAATAGLAAAERDGNTEAQCAMLHSLALAHWRAGKHADAITCLTRALPLCATIDWPDGWATILHGLSGVYWQLGRLDQSAGALEQAVGLCRQHQLTGREAACLSDLGTVYHDLGRLPAALDCLERSIELHRQLHDDRSVALATGYSGDVYHELGELDRARSCHEQAYGMCSSLGSTDGAALALRGLAAVSCNLGQLDQALATAKRGLELAAAAGNDPVLVDVRNTLGNVYRLLGLAGEAGRQHSDALLLSRRADYIRGECSALAWLAAVALDQGEHETALAYCQQSLAITGNDGYPLIRARIFTTMADIHRQRGNHDIAARYHQDAVALNRGLERLQNASAS